MTRRVRGTAEQFRGTTPQEDRLWHLSQAEREAGMQVTEALRRKHNDALNEPTWEEERHARDMADLGHRIVQIAREGYPEWVALTDVLKGLDALGVAYSDRIEVEQSVWRQARPDRFEIRPLPNRATITYSLHRGIRWIDPEEGSDAHG